MSDRESLFPSLRQRLEESRRKGYGVPRHDVDRLLAAAEALADLAFEGRIRGLGDPVEETADPTGVLSRTNAALRELDR